MGRCYRRGFDLIPFYAFINFISNPGDEVTVTNKGRTYVVTLDDDGRYKFECTRTGTYTAHSGTQGSTDVFDIQVKGASYNMKLILNTHDVLGGYPHYILDQFSHEELRELILPDEISAEMQNLAKYPCSDLQGIKMSHLHDYGMRKVV